MRSSEFALKNNFSNVDKDIVKKLHGNEEKTEQEWFGLFKGNINFDNSSYLKKQKVIEKIDSIKNNKKTI